MPKIPVDYSKSIIYKICCKDINIIDCYVGSSTNFTKRKYHHKSNVNISNIYLYQFIRDNGGWDNWDMVEVEKYNAIDKNDLHKRERFYIEELKATLNKVIPSRTKKEWYDDNKGILKEKWKDYYEDNKKIIKEYQKEYYDDNKEVLKEKFKEYYNDNKSELIGKQKEYYEKNKEDIKEYKKEYQEKNKEKIKEYKKKWYENKKHLEYVSKIEI